jgi:polyisoprenyl-phosphate glycosyltransferase
VHYTLTMGTKLKSLDIVTSALNEEDCLPELYRRICSVMLSHPECDWRLLIVDNGSTDNTWQIITEMSLKDPRVIGTRFSKTFPLDNAFTCGLDLATAQGVVVMASDLQDPPELFNDFLTHYDEGFEQVIVRITKRDTVPWIYRRLSQIFYSLANRITNDMIPRNVSDFRFLTRPAYEAARSMRERHRFLRALFAWTGFRTKIIELERPPRFGGDSKFVGYRLKIIIEWAARGILAHTTYPLTLISLAGICTSIISFFITLIFSLVWITRGVPFAGFGTIVGIVALGFSLVLLCLGIMAQYIALIYEEVKQRPIYLVAERTLKSEEE